MASDKKTFEAVVSGGGTIAFRDLERLLVKLRDIIAHHRLTLGLNP